MKTKRTRVLSIILGVFMALTLGLFTACSPRGSGKNVDSSKSQLNIGTFGGGYGTAYLQDLKERFEDYYKDHSFEDGKKGVQVWYTENKDRYTVETFVDTIGADTNDIVYMSGSKNYEMVDAGTIVDITDIVTTPLTEYGETKSIADKMNDAQKDYFNYQNKYHTLPFVETSLGLMFDIDVFEENDLYLAKNGAPSEALQEGGSFNGYQWVGATGDRSAGPDGRYDTQFDNGLPATLDEFQALVDKMYEVNINSIIWTGQYADTYSTFLTRSFQINYHGVEESMIMYDGGGAEGRNTRLVTGFNPDGSPKIETVKVGLNNIKELGKQAGIYYGLKMFEILLSSGTVSDYVPQELSHVRTQEKFLVSNHRFGETPIAFMVDGTWWENEANTAGIFKDNEEEFGLGRKDRRFGYYTLPNATIDDYAAKVTANNDNDTTNDILNTIDAGGGGVIINARISEKQQEIAKTFIRFAHTDESLRRFTVNTSLPAAFQYEIGDAASETTVFAKSYLEVYQNSNKFYNYKPYEMQNNNALKNIEQIITYQWSSNASGDLGRFADICPDKINAEDYFVGIYKKLLNN